MIVDSVINEAAFFWSWFYYVPSDGPHRSYLRTRIESHLLPQFLLHQLHAARLTATFSNGKSMDSQTEKSINTFDIQVDSTEARLLFSLWDICECIKVAPLFNDVNGRCSFSFTRYVKVLLFITVSHQKEGNDLANDSLFLSLILIINSYVNKFCCILADITDAIEMRRTSRRNCWQQRLRSTTFRLVLVMLLARENTGKMSTT